MLSEETGDYILDFMPIEKNEELCSISINNRYQIVYSKENFDAISGKKLPFRYRYIPKLYGLMDDEKAMGDTEIAYIQSGIRRLQNSNLNLRGRGCIICFIDTGIDFTHPDFCDDYGNSRILSIWDQTLQEGKAPEGFFIGTEYPRSEIQFALEQENPKEYVKSEDRNGHGTKMALLGAGKMGAAPDALLVIVKLKPCKDNLRDFYSVPKEAEAYSETDIMLAIKYGEQFVKLFERPIVYCLGLGTSMGDHSGKSFLDRYAGEIALQKNHCMIVCSGNEGNAAHHYRGNLMENGGDKYEDVEMRVGEEEKGFVLEFWGMLPDVYEMEVRSPGGERALILAEGNIFRRYSFIYENTGLEVEKQNVEVNSGRSFARLKFINPTGGIWTIRVKTVGKVHNGVFHMWLPIQAFLAGDTYFLKPDPNMTITDPGMNDLLFTVGGYNPSEDSFYLKSGRGFNIDAETKPDIVSPCVALLGSSGSSFGAAITAGAAAQFMEWAVGKGNLPLAETVQIKNYFMQGAKRKPTYSYPNREWGYGALNMQGVFNLLAGIPNE